MATRKERPAKRVKLFSDEEKEESSSDTSDGVASQTNGVAAPLKINEDYARRFEHNSQRAERHRLEEKYGKDDLRKKATSDADAADESDSSSSSSEDDDGILASGRLEDEYSATLRAIRNRDPRLYDAKSTFFTEAEEPSEAQGKREKPMYLRDFHRENLLQGNIEPEKEPAKPTYVQQQEHLKQAVVKEMHDAAAESEDEDAEDFLVARQKTSTLGPGQHNKPLITATEVENAGADPDAFLSKFMDSRAWVQAPGIAFHPFESEDESEDERAEAAEEAYNFRFEDPSKANEKLVSHARDAVAKYSVRKDAPSKRQRAREVEKEEKEASKAEKRLEKARLRKFRVDEAQEKLARIKEAAGAKSSSLKLEDWHDLLTGDFDEEQWEQEMQKKFNDEYYGEQSESESGNEPGERRRPKAPKWKDDIDITDLVPDFDDADETRFALSSDENDHTETIAPPISQKQRKKDKLANKAERRQERARIEQLMDAQLDLEATMKNPHDPAQAGAFRYRDTSPSAYGMTSKDILLASDQQLNQFAGLKKLAAFRDPEKKRRDKKRLGKKARLREWRKETFGSERGPRQSLQDSIRAQLRDGAPAAPDELSRMPPGKKRKRSKATEAA